MIGGDEESDSGDLTLEDGEGSHVGDFVHGVTHHGFVGTDGCFIERSLSVDGSSMGLDRMTVFTKGFMSHGFVVSNLSSGDCHSFRSSFENFNRFLVVCVGSSFAFCPDVCHVLVVREARVGSNLDALGMFKPVYSIHQGLLADCDLSLRFPPLLERLRLV